MSVSQVEREIRKRVMRALKAVGKAQTDLYRKRVSEAQTKPVGSGKRHGDTHEGQIVERSQPGEFPRKEFHEAMKGVKMGVDNQKMEVRSGVTEQGMPLYFLSHGHHYRTLERFDRLGMDQLFLEELDGYREIARHAMEEDE